jgi:hypothetical protein
MEGHGWRDDEEMVETEEKRKARKEHESASHDVGLRATLDAGRLRDAMANVLPAVEKIKEFAVILEELQPEVDLDDLSEALEVTAVIEDEVTVEDAVQEPEESEEKEFDLAEAKSLIARLKSLVGEE